MHSLKIDTRSSRGLVTIVSVFVSPFAARLLSAAANVGRLGALPAGVRLLPPHTAAPGASGHGSRLLRPS